MPTFPEIQVLEHYREVPIVQLAYPVPTLLTEEMHLTEVRCLSDLPFERFALIASFQNLSWSSEYGPQEMAQLHQSEEFRKLQARLVTVVRYHAGSLTSMIHTMSAYTMMRSGSCNFAPDLESALRLVRRQIDRTLTHCEA
jgi:hypothetical protein